MKANKEGLIKAMELCAKAHHAKFSDWSEDEQLGIKSEDEDVVSDVKLISAAFYGKAYVDVEAAYGYTTLWMQDKFLRTVNLTTLASGLKEDWYDEWKRFCLC